MSGHQHLTAWLVLACLGTAPCRAQDVQEIIRRATEVVKADWDADLNYARIERDEIRKGGSLTIKTSEVVAIEGSSYYLPIAVNDEPLSPGQRSVEIQKLKNEIQRRRAESPSAREKRIANYKKQRDENASLLLEVPKAKFELLREETVDGYRAWVISAVPPPRTGSAPLSRAAKVMRGMRGTLWIGKDNFQLIRAEGRVVTPVPVYGILAQVLPGTRIEVGMAPVSDSVWLVSRFSMNLNLAKFFFFRSTQETRMTFSDFRPNSEEIDELTRQ